MAEIMQLGMDMRAADLNETAPPDATVEIVDSLPGGRPFLWLNRPDAVRLLVARGEMSEDGAQQFAEVLSHGAAVEGHDATATASLDGTVGLRSAAPASGPPKPPR
ncbi:hypothetical protein G3I60_06960 [Streptomyces sp. SID13666]|uniref:hypothetical protein n=1 Tax=unclassified Streptomyces TaxID=2593676 RepID=UPI0013C26F92|nr:MULTISPECIES: hypothetical protein [unclassified Streptomyces]NEA53902.1 hypothetical protein [Streptomyces sp. SID13666]NEA76231.1 hypothetical protein [Streptomyces sp. SID13588]